MALVSDRPIRPGTDRPMLKIAKLTDYGIVVLTHIANAPDRVHRVTELAEELAIPAPTVAKLAKTLARDGLLISHRGAHGGYRLARPAAEIRVVDIVESLEGPVAIMECIEHPGTCRQESVCQTRGNWIRINRAISRALEGISLADMAADAAVQPFPAAQAG